MSLHDDQRSPQRENFFTLRAKGDELAKELTKILKEDDAPQVLVGSPSDARCRYFSVYIEPLDKAMLETHDEDAPQVLVGSPSDARCKYFGWKDK